MENWIKVIIGPVEETNFSEGNQMWQELLQQPHYAEYAKRKELNRIYN